MNPESIRQALRELYESVWLQLLTMKDEGISQPLLIGPPDAYFSAKLKLMIVGKETGHKWPMLDKYEGKDPNECCQELHRAVVTDTKARGIFHKGARKLQQCLTPEVPHGGFIWANLFPCNQRGGCPGAMVAEELLKLRLLPQEVKILQPQAVVFFTGTSQSHWNALNTLFPRAKYHPCEDVDPLLVCRVQHDDLPAATFRTYHPGFLRFGKWWIIERLAALIRGTQPAVSD